MKNYSDFCCELRRAGFALAMGNAHGIYALPDFPWDEDPGDSPIRWHTGDPETDPWEWRMRVLEEEGDIAYGKVFFKGGGYMTAAWAPYFLAARRDGLDARDFFEDGRMSRMAYRIYEVLREGPQPMHALKPLLHIQKGERTEFDRAITELQMDLFVTLSGRVQRVNRSGEPYGWSSTTLSTVEDFWQARGVELPSPDRDEAVERIAKQVLRLNPLAKDRDIRKFIWG